MSHFTHRNFGMVLFANHTYLTPCAFLLPCPASGRKQLCRPQEFATGAQRLHQEHNDWTDTGKLGGLWVVGKHKTETLRGNSESVHNKPHCLGANTRQSVLDFSRLRLTCPPFRGLGHDLARGSQFSGEYVNKRVGSLRPGCIDGHVADLNVRPCGEEGGACDDVRRWHSCARFHA